MPFFSPQRGTVARPWHETFYVKLKLKCRIFRGRYHDDRRLGEKKIIREPHDVTRTERPRGPSYGGFEAIEAAAKLQPDVILMGHQPMFLWILMALLRRQTHGTISLIAQTSQERFSNTKKETS